jgi:N-acetylmuramoyl-L-alanine amidase
MAYKRVDLRDKLPGQPWSNINGLERERKGFVPEKKPGRIVIHYSDQDFEGEDIYDRLRHGKTTVLQVLTSEARGHMSQPRLDPTFRTNGIQYHYSVWRDMVFQCRNEEALLWHCNDGIGADSYNYTAIAVHVPTTRGFPASKQTVQTLTEFVADKLKEHGATSRSNVKGHQEISATECPGPLMNQFVLAFRTGNLNPGEDPGGQIGGDHSDIPVDGNMSRWEFGQVDVERLKIPIAIQYDGHHTWDFKPTTADRPGVPNWSRRQFMQARIQDIPSDLDVTFAGEKFGEIRKVDQPPDTDGVPDWVRRPLAFLEAAKGGKYTAWKEAMGKFADGPPAWVSNTKPPPAAAVKSRGGFCFTGGTVVTSPPVEKSYKRLYSGEVVTIKTAGGHKLTGTPNHPILTDKGWLPLKSLRNGVHVVSSPVFRQLSRFDPDYYQKPACLEDVHRSLADAGIVDRHTAAPFDFHGDGRDGEVEIVVPERVLRDGLQASFDQQCLEFSLSDAPFTDPAFTIGCLPNQKTAGVGALSCLMGSPHLSESFGRRSLGVLHPLRFRDAAQGDARVFEPVGNSRSASAHAGSYRSGGFTGEVFSDDGFSIEGQPDRGLSGAMLIPTESGAFGEAPGFNPGLFKSVSNESVRYTETPGNLWNGIPFKIGFDYLATRDIISPVIGGPELDASSLESIPNSGFRNSEEFTNFLERMPGSVCLDEVIGVDVGTFSGHVYNLQTKTGWYFANGILAHNCASLPNLACRVNDVDIFADSAKWWAGGVPWWGERVLNKKVARKFVLNRRYPPGTLFLRRYTGPALAKQGHVAILLRGRTLIQSDLQLGINSSRTLESTHNSLGKFEYYILPEDWLKPTG